MGSIQYSITTAIRHINASVRLRGFVFLIPLALAFFAVPDRAEAIPAFAKKHNAPCTLCHTVWPRLNAEGFKYKMNAYQMSDSRDGSETGKISPALDLHLDTGKANPPLSLRMSGGLSVFGPKSGPNGDQANNFPCCMNGNTMGLYAAGTIEQDIGYFAAYQVGKTDIDQGHLSVANIFGPGYLGVDLGGLRTADSDAVSPNREWFGSANPAFFGNLNAGARDVGLGLGYTDSGLRFFGNPDYGPFSYDVVVVSGSRRVGQGVSTRGSAYSLMARVDLGGFAGSFRYWDNKSGELLFKPAAPGYAYDLGQTAAAANEFAPDRLNTDEKTQDYLFAMNYRADRWELEAAYDMNNFSVGQRVSGVNTYTQTQMKRTGLAVAWIYRISPFMNFGMRYGTSTVKDYEQTVNGVTASIAPATVSQFELKWEALPAQNARISLQWTLDTSNEQARMMGNGGSYDLQNKLFLLWDWAI
ncbi:MAG: hypothetical protein HZA03_04510 [Nitrospinae bacterium]|nr:hypothetical protein [Nitrospinota bacterium]